MPTTGLTRRHLLASLTIAAAVANGPLDPALAATAVPAPSPAATTALTARETFYLAEHKWAVDGLLRAITTRDFAAWSSGDEAGRPDRWRLARRMTELQGASGLSPLETMLADEFAWLWGELTRASGADPLVG